MRRQARAFVARVRASPLARRAAHGALWSLIGSLAQRGASFAAWVGLARLLGDRQFGELGILSTTLGLCATLAGLGLGTTATKYIAEWRERAPARAGRVLAFCELLAVAGGCLAAVAVIIAAPWLARTGLSAPHLDDALRLMALMVPLVALNGVQISALYGLESFRTFARVNLATAVVSAAAPLLGARLGGVPGAVLGQVAAQAVMALVNHAALRRETRRKGIPVSVRDCFSEGRRVWNFSVPSLLASLVVLAANWICQSLLARRPDGYRDLAVLTATSQLQLLILYLSASLGIQILPMLANLDHRDDPARYRRALGMQFALNAGVTLFAGLCALAAAPWLLKLYGDEFLRGREVLTVLIGAALFLSLAGVAGKAIISLGHIWPAFLLNVVWAAVLVPLAHHLIATHAVMGFALAHLAAYAALTVACGVYLACALRRPAGAPGVVP